MRQKLCIMLVAILSLSACGADGPPTAPDSAATR